MWWIIGYFIILMLFLLFNYCIHGGQDANTRTKGSKEEGDRG
jgi:hypothetical protein